MASAGHAGAADGSASKFSMSIVSATQQFTIIERAAMQVTLMFQKSSRADDALIY